MGSRGQFTGRRGEDYFARASSTVGSLEKPRNQSAAVTHQPGAKRNKGSSMKTEAKKKDPPQVAPPRRESITPDAAQAAASQRVGKLEAILTTLEDDDETAAVIQVALTKARARHRNGHSRNVSSPRGSSWRGSRTGPCECRQGQGGSGRSSGSPGEGRIFVGRWGREVVLHPSPFHQCQSSPTSQTRCNVCSVS